MYGCTRILRLQLLHELTHGPFLCVSASVLRHIILSYATDVAYTNRISVVPLTVGAHLFHRSTGVNRAVAIDNKVIAYILPTVPFNVPLTYLFDGIISALRRSRAVQNYFVNLSHGSGVIS